MIHLKTIEELRLMRESAQLVSKTLGMIAKEIKPGVTTLHLDNLGGEFIRDHGGEPAFLGMYGFPKNLCISPNSVSYTHLDVYKRQQQAAFNVLEKDNDIARKAKNGYIGGI